MMQIDYPYHINGSGRTAQTGEDDHIRDLIEQVLFTSPGERVNRPTFGCGLMQLLFEPNDSALSVVTQQTVQGALQQWLGELILVENVLVETSDSSLGVTVQYIVRRSQQRRVTRFERAL